MFAASLQIKKKNSYMESCNYLTLKNVISEHIQKKIACHQAQILVTTDQTHDMT